MLEVYEGKTFVTVCLRTASRRPTRTVHELWIFVGHSYCSRGIAQM